MIRNAKKDDCLNLAALSIQVWLHSYAKDGIRTEISKYVMSTFTEKYFEDLLAKQHFKILVCIQASYLVGFITVNLESVFECEANGYEIDTLYVQEHFKGQGIGQSLLSKVRANFGNNHWLSTWVHNVNAIGFYKHIGFNDIGEIHFQLGGEQHENRVLAYNINVEQL